MMYFLCFWYFVVGVCVGFCLGSRKAERQMEAVKDLVATAKELKAKLSAMTPEEWEEKFGGRHDRTSTGVYEDFSVTVGPPMETLNPPEPVER